MEGSNNDNNRARTPENAEKAAAIVSNMALAHELVMNDNFEFQQLPENSLEKHVTEIVQKAFWNKLREDLESTPPVYTHALNLLVELKQNLQGLLLPHHKSLRSQIDGFLDVELIKQQIEHGALDLEQYAKAVVNILSKLCAPVRDEQVQSLLDVTGFVDMFREIFKVIDLMKMDMANFQINALKPQLMQQSIEYERTKFKQYLETNPDGLLSTKVWLSKGQEEATTAKTIAPSPSSTATSHDATDAANRDTSDLEVLAHAYLGIIFGEPSWPYPETLIMDELRLAEMRSSVHRTTLLGSIILVTMQTVARQLMSDGAYLKDLKQVLIILLDGIPEGEVTSYMSSIYEQVKEETNKVLEKRGFSSIIEEQDAMFKGQTTALGDPNHQIRKLLAKRAYDYMLNIIRDQLRHSNGRDSGHHPIPSGLESVNTELSELALRFARLVSHNAATYQPFYRDILHTTEVPQVQ